MSKFLKIYFVLSIIAGASFYYYLNYMMKDNLIKEKVSKEFDGEWTSMKGEVVTITSDREKYNISYSGKCNISFSGQIYNLDYKDLKENILILESNGKCNRYDIPEILVLKFQKRLPLYVELKYFNNDDLKDIVSNLDINKKVKSSIDNLSNKISLTGRLEHFENMVFKFNKNKD